MDSRKHSCIDCAAHGRVMHGSQPRTQTRALDFGEHGVLKRSLLRGTSSTPGDVASELARGPRAAGRAARIEDTRRADVQQEGHRRRSCRSLTVIRHF